jgi:hypothetical protein
MRRPLQLMSQAPAIPRQDARLASHIADEVYRTLKANQPKESFRRSESQMLGNAAMQLRRAGMKQG